MVEIVKFGQNCEIGSKLCCLDCERLSVGSGRLSVGSGRLSGWVGKSSRWAGQMGSSDGWVCQAAK